MRGAGFGGSVSISDTTRFYLTALDGAKQFDRLAQQDHGLTLERPLFLADFTKEDRTLSRSGRRRRGSFLKQAYSTLLGEVLGVAEDAVAEEVPIEDEIAAAGSAILVDGSNGSGSGGGAIDVASKTKLLGKIRSVVGEHKARTYAQDTVRSAIRFIQRSHLNVSLLPFLHRLLFVIKIGLFANLR